MSFDPAAGTPIRILLVEDDPGDAMLVADNLEDAKEVDCDLQHVTRISEIPTEAAADVILLDLGLPDANGLEAIQRAQATAPDVPIVVLTGRSDRDEVLPALAAGADDWLVKSEVSPERLARSIRHAIQRRRAEEDRRRLVKARQRERTARQLGRRLLPEPIVESTRVVWHYQPSTTLEVGGDFFDVVERRDGTLRVLIGDVSGHGPDEAALGISARVAWRSLILAGAEDHEILPLLDRILVAERGTDGSAFATICDVTITPDRQRLHHRLAGHPPPILVGRQNRLFDRSNLGPPVGSFPDVAWRTTTEAIEGASALVLYTDGLVDQGPDRFIEPEVLREQLRLDDVGSPAAIRAWTAGFLPPEEQTRDDLAIVAVHLQGGGDP